MRYENLPNGDQIPAIGLGTWEVGGYMSPDYTQDEAVVAAWRQALEMGYRHIDTAEMYGGGHTEELVRRVIENFDRSKLFITSKVWHTNLHSGEVIQACARSLERLGIDYLDLYLIHWPNESVPLEETFHALNELLERGTVRHVGVSNFNLEQLQRAQEQADRPLATNQVPYSLTNRKYVDNGVVEYCQKNGILVTAYTPVEKGRLSGHPILAEIADRYNATPIQIALAWLVQQPNVITIPQSTDPAHLRENLAAADLDLEPEDVERLDAVAEAV